MAAVLPRRCVQKLIQGADELGVPRVRIGMFVRSLANGLANLAECAADMIPATALRGIRRMKIIAPLFRLRAFALASQVILKF